MQHQTPRGNGVAQQGQHPVQIAPNLVPGAAQQLQKGHAQQATPTQNNVQIGYNQNPLAFLEKTTSNIGITEQRR